MDPIVIHTRFAFLLEYHAWWRFIHLAGVIIALGAVVAADLLLAWLKLRPQQAALMDRVTPLLSIQVWIGLLLLSFSGLMLFLPRPGLIDYAPFRWKMLLVLVVFLNGIALNCYIAPTFKSLVAEWAQTTSRVVRFMVFAGLSTAISFLAWWAIVVIMLVYY